MASGADTLRRSGEALYGPLFASELARQLRMSDRHMRRLLAGTHEPSPSLLEEVWRLLEDRKTEIDEAQAGLSREIAARR